MLYTLLQRRIKMSRVFIVILLCVILAPYLLFSEDKNDLKPEFTPQIDKPSEWSYGEWLNSPDGIGFIQDMNELSSISIQLAESEEGKDTSRLIEKALKIIHRAYEKTKRSPIKITGFSIGFPLGV